MRRDEGGGPGKLETRKISMRENFWSFRCIAAVVAASLTIGDTARAKELIRENFGGLATSTLNGTLADTFDAGILTAGGNATWAANATFLADGSVNNTNTNASAYLNLGSYINAAKGTDSGKFVLQASISQTAGSWLSLGFGAENQPSVDRNFTNSGGSGTTNGLATIIYRSQTATPAGELDMFLGLGNASGIDGPDLGAGAGTRTLSITLDLTPAGGYNGSNNFGTVTWADSVLGVIGTGTYGTSRNFGSILLSKPTATAASTGTYEALTLTQVIVVPEPGSIVLLATGGLLVLVWIRRRPSNYPAFEAVAAGRLLTRGRRPGVRVQS